MIQLRNVICLPVLQGWHEVLPESSVGYYGWVQFCNPPPQVYVGFTAYDKGKGSCWFMFFSQVTDLYKHFSQIILDPLIYICLNDLTKTFQKKIAIIYND